MILIMLFDILILEMFVLWNVLLYLDITRLITSTRTIIILYQYRWSIFKEEDICITRVYKDGVYNQIKTKHNKRL